VPSSAIESLLMRWPRCVLEKVLGRVLGRRLRVYLAVVLATGPGNPGVASAKNISVWVDWLRQNGRAPSEPSETPRGRISPRPASIRRVELHIPLRLPFRRFFLLCRPPTLNKHSGVVANCDRTSEWVHCVHACIGIAMHKDPHNCADPGNLAKS
jgi:hypothetical protein